ncbi:enoyl-CoA hydratase/isomerase family protein [Prauserella flavalba]|uniref:enoyl-CoA hydratase/isomerase family protein n=1 Tax=Prauserella flavalba TaxID=1477506 RepID=UPI0036EB2F7B
MSEASTEAPGTGEVRVERSGDIVTVTIDRPRRANALDAASVERLLTAVDTAGGDGTRALVLQGAGRHFCAGFDMAGVLDSSDGDLLWRFVRIEQLLQRLRRAPFVTVACVGGKAIGAGADIVASCAYRLLDPQTTLRFPGFRFGVALGTRHLAALVGTRAARDLLLHSSEVDAATAVRLGLGSAVVAREQQQEEAERILAATGTVDVTSVAAILSRTAAVSDADDAADLAALVTSLTRPGLHDRLARYLGGTGD